MHKIALTAQAVYYCLGRANNERGANILVLGSRLGSLTLAHLWPSAVGGCGPAEPAQLQHRSLPMPERRGSIPSPPLSAFHRPTTSYGCLALHPVMAPVDRQRSASVAGAFFGGLSSVLRDPARLCSLAATWILRQ